MSTRPSCSIAASTSAWQSSGLETSVATAIALRPACLDELLGLLELLHAPRAERDVGARLGQRLRERHAEPRRGPGHDRHLAVQLEPVQNASWPAPYPLAAEPYAAAMGAALGWGALAASSLVIGALLGVAPAVAEGAGRRRARVRRGRADQRRQLRPRRGGLAARRPGHGRHRPGGRRADLLRARPRRSTGPGRRRAAARSPSARSSTASPSRWCSGSASPPARASASGCSSRSSSPTCRRRSARRPTCAPPAGARRSIRLLWIAVAVICTLATVGG